tara:strand:+ start:5911 stop:6303 length:393 start_codon:yes stop_codon:yes gene_type:complete
MGKQEIDKMGIRGPKPGTPRVGGRDKGTPNKKTVALQERVKKFMQQQGIKNFDPLVALAGIAVDKATPLKLKVESLKELAQYLHPKRRAVEVSGEQTINVQEKEKKLKEIDDLLEEIEGKKITQNSDVLN